MRLYKDSTHALFFHCCVCSLVCSWGTKPLKFCATANKQQKPSNGGVWGGRWEKLEVKTHMCIILIKARIQHTLCFSNAVWCAAGALSL